MNPARDTRPARLCIMISGGGRSLLNLLDHIRSGALPATVELVIANRDCPGAAHARDRNIDTRIIPGEIPADTLAALLREKRIDYVVMAGYLKFLNIPPDFARRIVNIHPALLPHFGGKGMYGHHVHEAVIAAGARTSGCTVHLATPEFDAGPIILQMSCPVLPTDTADTLAARVFDLERTAYPEALRRLITGSWKPPAETGESTNR